MKSDDFSVWLDASGNQRGSILHKEPAEGTCRWIHSKELFSTWKNSGDPTKLWISGKPGMPLFLHELEDLLG
jgi:hypothetical protein